MQPLHFGGKFIAAEAEVHMVEQVATVVGVTVMLVPVVKMV